MDAKTVERFWSLVDRRDVDECWLWKGTSCGHDGRELFYFSGQRYIASRFALIASGVELPKDKFACHKCDVPKCCNPNHLYVGDNFTNRRDAAARKRLPLQNRTHCINGHPLEGENLMLDFRGHRRCRTCQRVHVNKNKKKARAQRKLAAIDAAREKGVGG